MAVKQFIKPISRFIQVLAAFFLFLSIQDLPLINSEYLKCWSNECETLPFPIWKGFLFLAASCLYGVVLLLWGISWFFGRKENNVTTTLKNKLWETELRAFADNVRLTRFDRVTLYVFVSKTGSFFKAGRESPNNAFKNGGRRVYTSGVIENAFNNGECLQQIDADPEDDHNAYLLESAEKSGLKKSTLKNISMPSRYLYGQKVVRLNGDPVGVLLIESTKRDITHIEYDDGACLHQDRIARIFSRECRRLSHFLNEFEEPRNLFDFEESAT